MKRRILDLTNLGPEQTRKLNALYNEYSDEYTRHIDSVAQNFCNNRYWKVTPLFSRNIYMSNSLKLICLLKVCVDEIESDEVDIVYVQNYILKRALKRNCKTGIEIRIKKSKEDAHVHYYVLNLVVNLWRVCKRIFLAHKSCNRDYSKNIDKTVTLFGSYRESSEFSSGKFIDRYFTGLKEQTEKEIYYLDIPFYSKWNEGVKLNETINNMTDHFVVERYLRYSDLMDILRYWWFCQKTIIDEVYFDGFSVGEILTEDIRIGSININAWYGLLRGVAVQRLIEGTGIRIDAVVDWYEGQPSSNGLFAFIRDKYPNILTIAYTYGQIGEKHISMSPSESQVRSKSVAEVYAIHGNIWEEKIKRFSSSVACILAPSFRDQIVFEVNDNREIEKNSILVLVPMERKYAEELLNVMQEVVDRLGKCHLYIKEHPSYENNRIKINKLETCHVTYTSDVLPKIICGKETVIVCDSTSMFYIIYNGVCCINYVPNGELESYFLPEDMKMYINMAYSANDIVYAIESNNNKSQKKRAFNIKESHTKVDATSIKGFFGEIEHYTNYCMERQ